MNKTEIITILNDWNFWNRDMKSGILRKDYLDKLEKSIETDQIVVITGARRSGKSYLMRQTAKYLIQKGIDKKDILFINFEDPRFTNLNTDLLIKIFDTYVEFFNPLQRPYIFLDEIQEVKGWEKWVRTIHELDKAKIIISGSNAKLLSQELSTLLTGRHLDITVFPLSFKEFLFFNDLKIENSLDLLNCRLEINNLLKVYFEFGSFPEVVLNSEKSHILISYFDDIINKDLVRRFKIRKSDKVKNLINFYLNNISSTITFNSIQKHLDITTNTVEKFSGYLETVFLIFFVKRFSFKAREQDKSPRKVYCIDTGLVNTLGFRFSENTGRMAENLVFLKLAQRKSANPLMNIYYWKNEKHREVDFVVKEGLKIKELIQVCWNLDDFKTRKRELDSLVLGMNALKFKEGLILTEDFEGEDVINEKKNYIQIPLQVAS